MLADPTSPAYRPHKIAVGPKSDVTVSEYLKIVQEECYPARDKKGKTFEQYAQCLRRLAADIGKINNRGTIGHRFWRAAVESVKLTVLTDSALKKWQNDYLDDLYADEARHKRAGMESAMEHAHTSVITTFRMSKVLFGDDVIKQIKDKVVLPTPVPFSSDAISDLVRKLRKKASSTKYKRTLGPI